jgi:hypothetical protein
MDTAGNATSREPWNKGRIVGQKAPFKLKDIWTLRVRRRPPHGGYMGKDWTGAPGHFPSFVPPWSRIRAASVRIRPAASGDELTAAVSLMGGSAPVRRPVSALGGSAYRSSLGASFHI